MANTRHPVSRSTAIVIGRAIERARDDNGWSQYALANAAGVSYNSVKAWESGETAPELGTLLHLADVMCLCSVDELLGGSLGLKAVREASLDPSARHGGPVEPDPTGTGEPG